MALSTDLHYILRTKGFADEDLRVVRFSGVEGVSSLFEFEIEIAVQGLEVEFEEQIGEEATFVWTTTAGDRHLHGIVSSWEELGRGKKETRYLVTIVPRLWMLSLSRQSRIFQGKSGPDIVKQVLEEGGLPSSQFCFALQRGYKPRTYCVQYRESDLDFVMRILEEEGIFFFFENTEDGQTLVMADKNEATVPLEGGEDLVYREGDTGMGGVEHVMRLEMTRSLRHGAITLTEFDFKKPQLSMKVESAGESDKEKKLVSIDFPGEYHETNLGKELAKIRLEEERAERLLGVGESDCRRFIPGYRFTLAEHANDTLNQEYLLLRVRHRGRQPQGEQGGETLKDLYRNSFECIPASTPYHPPRVTPRPTVDGPQTATVVGPSGQEIHCDEHGRVKVLFPWDRQGKKDDTASCWIRVSQLSGGGGWGAMVIPRVGQEVVVIFLEGDPDRPIVTGRVYNGEAVSPYALPGQNTVSTLQSQISPGGGVGNEVRFSDNKGTQQMFFFASKDKEVTVANDRKRDVVVHELEEILGNRQRSVGDDETITVKGNRKETVGGNQFILITKDHKLNVDGSVSIDIGTLRARIIKGESKLEVEDSYTLSPGAVMLHAVKGDYEEKVEKDAKTSSPIQAELVKGESSDESKDLIRRMVGGLIMKKSNADISIEGDASVTVVSALCKIKADGDVTVDAKEKVILTGSGGAVAMGSSGIVVTGKDLNFKGDVKIKASVIVAN